jgi:salicylate hydroxylase
MTDAPIIIAGGGIGGLAAALAIARHGGRAVVLEQAAAFGEIGAGIQIGPNAFHCLDVLGVGGALKDSAVFIDSLLLMDAVGGDEIARIPLDQMFRQRFANPYAVVHRADLHQALYDGCQANGRVELRTSSRVVDFTQRAQAVTVRLPDGTSLDGAALIGADGLRSAIRARIVADGEPRVSGHTTYRSVIPTEQMPAHLRWNAATLWAGPKCHIVHYPLKGGRVFNLVITRDDGAPEAFAGKPVADAEVHAAFAHVCAPAREIIARGRDWNAWVLADREPVSNWTDGRVALLGDAAHPTLQYLAQGACMAMEDGVVLGAMLASHATDVPAALKAYNAARAVRTARVQMGSRLMGEYVYHPGGAKAAVRNAALQAMSPTEFHDEFAWLYSVRVGQR